MSGVLVAAVDNSPLATTVVERAVEHARRWEAELHVLHVFHPPVSIYALESGFALEAEALEESERAAVWNRLTEPLDSSGVNWVRVDRQGYPASQICAYADEVNAELVIVGTRGRGEFAALVLGSTSHGVIHDAPCDVLVVRT
jgi:nucleotide-binding universal stress UspA family protein